MERRQAARVRKLTQADGAVYEGGFQNGEPHGHGKMTYADGYVYEGEWKDGEHHGQGCIQHAHEIQNL